MEEKTDKELYNEFLLGNKQSFDQIVIRHKNSIIYFIQKYVKSIDIAEDLAQDVFVYILINKKNYKFEYSLKTYLYTIAKSKAINYIKREMNLAIGETTAEQIKMEIGCAMPLMTDMNMEIRGRDLSTGLPKNVIVSSSQIEEAMQESISKIVEIVKQTLERTPPELASDIMEKGIVLAGGGALIRNLDKLLSNNTGMPVYVAEDPLDCVAKGAGRTLEDLEKLKTVLINARKRR